MKIIKQNTLILELSKVSEYKKITSAETNEDREEYLERNKTIIQLLTKINPR